PAVRHVAVVLAAHLRYDMTGAAAVDHLAALTGRKRHTIIAALRTLRAGGWLTVTRAATRGRATEYVAEIPALINPDGVPLGALDTPDGVSPGARHPRNGVPLGSPDETDGVPLGSLDTPDG